MKGFIRTKKIISIVLILLLFLGNFTYGQTNNHWAYKNYESIREKTKFTGEFNDFDRNITFSEFKEVFESVTGIIIHNDEGVDNSELTRKDIIKLLSETLDFEEVINISIDSYNDYNQIDENMKHAVNKLLSLGIISGYSDNTLRINNKLTLGEAITLIKRANELRIINSIDTATVNVSREELEMGYLSKATNNAVYMFVYATLLTEELINTEYHEDIIDDWILKRDEAIEAWDKVYKNSLIMNYSADLYIQDLENKINDSLSGFNDKNFEWAKRLQEQFDAIKGSNKLKQLSEQLGMDAKEAYEALTLSHEIVHGNALREENFYRYAEIIAKATKTASKVGLLIGATVASGGAATGYVSLTEGAGILVSGVDAIIDVYSTGSNIILGENAASTIAFNKLEDDFAPVSSIFGLTGFNASDTADKLFFIGEELTDFVFDGKLLGINVTDNSIGGSISYFNIPLENGKFPDDLSNFELLNLMGYNAIKDIAYEISDYALNLPKDDKKDYQDILEMLRKELEEIEESTKELIEEIEEKEDKPIEEIFEEIEEKLIEDELNDIKDEKDDNKDKNKNDDEDDNDEIEEPEDPEDSEKPEDPEDPEKPEDPDDPDEPEKPTYYSLKVYYVLEYSDEEVVTPPTFAKNDYKHGDSYNIPVPRIEGYTPDRDSVVGTITRNEVITVTYTKDTPYTSLYINYVIADDKVVEPYFAENLKVGDKYSIPSPVVEGYTPDVAVVTGVIEEGVNTHTVTYTRDDKYFTITIRYVYADEELNEIGEPFEIVEHEVKVGNSYEYISPEKPGYRVTPEKFSGTMNDTGTNIIVTVKYIEELNTDNYEISGTYELETVRIPEGLSLEQAMAELPEKILAYINAGNATMEIDVDWKVNLEQPYPSELIFDKYNYTGYYEFEGEYKLPDNVTNPWEFKPVINVEIYPVVEDINNPQLDYTLLSRGIEGSYNDYTVWYEDDYGEIQGVWENYVDGCIYKRCIYKDNYMDGLYEEFAGENYGKTVELYYTYGYDEIDEVYRSFKEGTYKSWHNNGNKWYEGQLSNDLKTGEWKEYYSSGNLYSQGKYENNLIVDYQVEDWKYYYENGKVECEGEYSEGKRVDVWIFYNEDGSIDYKWNYTTGEYVD